MLGGLNITASATAALATWTSGGVRERVGAPITKLPKVRRGSSGEPAERLIDLPITGAIAVARNSDADGHYGPFGATRIERRWCFFCRRQRSSRRATVQINAVHLRHFGCGSKKERARA